MKLDLESYSMQTKDHTVSGEILDRELSWLAFNERVLYCANDKSIPLNERLKFLAITHSNLDEFISVRFSQYQSDDNPMRETIRDSIKEQMRFQIITYRELLKELHRHGKSIVPMTALNKKERKTADTIYETMIFPALTPVYVGSSNDVPNTYNGQMIIALIVKSGQLENLIFIPIPKHVPKFFHIGNDKIVLVEDIIMHNIKELCVNKQIEYSGIFRINKDFSVCLNHDTSKFILDRMMHTIEERNASNPFFLSITPDTPKTLKKVLLSIFGIQKKNVFDMSPVLDYTRFMTPILDESYSYEPFTPFQFEIVGEAHSIFSVLKNQDILLHHPYDSYDTVVKFIEHAAVDPKVRSIKQTLYRVSSEDSPIINALCRAAREGKTVTVLIEIKARFDETQNMALISKLKRNGVDVVLGFENLKTHCKMCIVVRQEKEQMRVYSHIATGNYNEKTAKQYTDLSYLTSKGKIGYDLLSIFNILSGVSTPDEGLQRVFYAPVNLRKRLMKCIDREISHAKKGKRAEIFLKLNSLNDPGIINKLNEAASKGVKIYILCRGICCILPSENIYIKSIVGRFLEHSRIYYFRNGGNEDYYISSADLLTRNLDRRVEILFLLKDSSTIRKIKHIVKAFKEDRKNSFRMGEKGIYKKMSGDFDCHQWFIDKSSRKVKIGKK